MTEGQQRLHLFLIVVFVVFALALVIAFMSWGDSLPRLSGQRVHDFGTVEAGPDRKEALYTFDLTNETDKWIEINHMSPSCSCTEVSANLRQVEPGGRVSITTAMQPSMQSGSKTASVTLTLNWLEDPTGSTQTREKLQLKMMTKRVPALWTRAQILSFRSGLDSLAVEVYAEESQLGSGKSPPELTASDPEGLSLEIAAWRRMKSANETTNRPALYAARVDITRTDGGETLPKTIPIVFHSGDLSCTLTLDTVSDLNQEESESVSGESDIQPVINLGPVRPARTPLLPGQNQTSDTDP